VPVRFLPTKLQPDSASHRYNRGICAGCKSKASEGDEPKTKLKKPKSKRSPKPKRAGRPSRAVEAHREELKAQLSPQEEETYLARLRAASERAVNDVTNATCESQEDD
jgi:hypothetical protein